MDPPNLAETLNDTEGLVVGLYQALQRKTHKGLPCPDVLIPHTVLYQDSRPVAWYFTSLKENKIYRKKKNNLTGAAIWDAFSSGRDPEVDVCCWFSGNMTRLTSMPKMDKSVKDNMYELDPEEDVKEPASFEYLVYDRVQRLVAPGQYTVVTEQVYDGLMQKFIQPREAQDSMIRVIWSPTACVCERRHNRFTLNDPRATLPDRMASFEANNFWLNTHTQLPAGSVLARQLGAQCDTIVRHLRDTTSGRVVVARMEMYFKVDAINRVWLLYCNSLRLDRTVRAVDRAPSLQRQYTLLDPTRHNPETHIPVDDTPFLCCLTGEMVAGSQRVDVTYKLLIAQWFSQTAGLSHETDRLAALDAIPPAIRRANPNISRDYYLRMRSQPMFLLKTAAVSAGAAAELSAQTLQDLARTITRPTTALAGSAARGTLSSTINAAGNKRVSAAGHAPGTLSLTMPSKTAATAAARNAAAGKLQPLVPSSLSAPLAAAALDADEDILYQPGSTIPAALLPKATLKSVTVHSGRDQGETTLPVLKPAGNGTTNTQHLNGGGQANGAGGPASPPRRAAHTKPAPEPVILSRPAKKPPPPVAVTSATTSPHANGVRSPPRGKPPGGHNKGEARSPGGRPAPMGSAYLHSKGGAQGGAATRASHVSNDDLRTLAELSHAYATAEAKTQELLAQVHEVLNEPPPQAARRLSGETGEAAPTTGSKRASATGSRPGSGAAAGAGKAGGASRPPSGAGGSGALGLKPGGLSTDKPPPAGLTSAEAAILKEALAEG